MKPTVPLWVTRPVASSTTSVMTGSAIRPDSGRARLASSIPKAIGTISRGS